MISIKYYRDEGRYLANVEFFICPHCNDECFIDNQCEFLFVEHINNYKCEVLEILLDSRHIWKIDRSKPYKQRLEQFFNSKEYPTHLKEQIIKYL